MPLFLFIFHIFISYIHSFIQSHSYITFIRASPFAEVSLHFLIACLLSGEHLPVVPSRESNSGLPYSKPTRCQLCHAAPWMNSMNKSLVGCVSDPDSVNPDPDILRNTDPGCCRILNQAVAESGSSLLLNHDPGCCGIRIQAVAESGSRLFLNPDPSCCWIRIQAVVESGSKLLLNPDPGCCWIRIQAVVESGSKLLLNPDPGCCWIRIQAVANPDPGCCWIWIQSGSGSRPRFSIEFFFIKKRHLCLPKSRQRTFRLLEKPSAQQKTLQTCHEIFPFFGTILAFSDLDSHSGSNPFQYRYLIRTQIRNTACCRGIFIVCFHTIFTF